MMTMLLAAAMLLPVSAVLLALVARRLGIGLSPTEGLRDLGAGWLYDTAGLARTPRSVLTQLRRQAARLHLALTHDRVFAPGEIVVELHPDEHDQVARLGRAGRDAVAAAAMSAARRNGWSPPGRVPVVRLETAPSVRRGRPNLLGSGWGSDGRQDGYTRPQLHPADTTEGPRAGRDGRDTTVALIPASGVAVQVTAPDGRHVVLADSSRSVVLGRSSAADLQIVHSGVSRIHARISLHAGHGWVEDLGSTNGTFVDGLRLNAPELLTGPVVVRLGADGPAVKLDPRSPLASATQAPTGADG